MRRMRTPLSVFALLAMLLPLSLIAVHISAQENNLLANPGFEPPFPISAGLPPMQVAQGWLPWYIGTQPQYYASSNTVDGVGLPRVIEGDGQQFFSYYNTHTGGVYQSVANVQPGSDYTFSVNAYIWSTNGSDQNTSTDPGGVVVEVGIDPNGGADGSSANIVWSPSVERYDAFNLYTVTASAASTTITVWVRSTVTTPVQYSVVYLDNASLTGISTASAATEVVTAEASAAVTAESTEVVVPVVTVEATTPAPVETQAVVPPQSTAELTQPPAQGTAEVTTEATKESTAVPTNTALPPTDTPTTEPTLTSTPMPPTLTNTPVPPTDTATTPPTETPTGAVPTAQMLVTDTPAGTAEVGTPSPTPTVDLTEFPYTLNYTVQNGDNPSTIAARFNSSTWAILSANQLGVDSIIYVGQSLIIPLRQPADMLTSTPAALDPLLQTATALISGLTQTASAPPAQVQSAMSVPPTSTWVSSNGCYYVRYGDTLGVIAARLGTTVRELARANNIVNINFVYAGQCLRVPSMATATSAAPVPTLIPATPTAVPQTVYYVHFGDTLYGISVHFGVSVGAILQANNLYDPNFIYVGQRLIIPR